MAQQKSTGTRASSSAAKTGGRKKTPQKKKSTQKKPMIRREIWAGVLLFLSFIAFLSFFNVTGFAIDWYRWLVGSLIGYGFYLMPFALLLSGALLIIKRRGKARLRVACLLLLPVVMGAMRHLLFRFEPFAFSLKTFGEMAASGRDMTGGGLIGGSLALFFRAAFSNAGAIALCILLLIAGVIIACNVSLVSLFKRLKPAPEPEEDTPPLRLPRREGGRRVSSQAAPADMPAPSGRTRVDVPLDDVGQAPRRSRRPAPERAPEPPREEPVLPDLDILAALDTPSAPAEPAPSPLPDTTVTPPWEETPPAAEPAVPPFEIRQAELAGPAGHAAAQDAPPADGDGPKPDEPAPEEAKGPDTLPDDENSYIYPPISLLNEGRSQVSDHSEEIRRYAERLVDTLQSFSIQATVAGVTRGPTVTRYELQLQRGVKSTRVASLSDDIALALGAASVRFSTIPDKQAIGIEVPNESQQMITIREILDSPEFKASKSRLSFAVGKDIEGKCVVGDIARMPHMLIAGTTGSGKSVCINSILISLIYKSTPEEVRLIMVDPKMIELSIYDGIPHLLIPVVTDPKKAAGALGWAVTEMMKRYKLFSEAGVRDLESYNREMRKREDGETLPQIVIVIDELADLMFVAAGEVEEAIARIAQMARAAGMHLIIATQRPSADVITGIMKANIPSRIAFTVASQIESRIILDTPGAEKLIGRGDMLYKPLDMNKPLRVQGCFITTKEVEEVVSFIKKTGAPEYSKEVIDHIERQAESGGGAGGIGGGSGEEDSMLQAAIEVVVERGQASVSMLQRRLKLGYSRAGSLMDEMEERGIVGPSEGSKPRQVLITRDQWKEMVLRRQDMD